MQEIFDKMLPGTRPSLVILW